jgi:hypothetical protein
MMASPGKQTFAVVAAQRWAALRQPPTAARQGARLRRAEGTMSVFLAAKPPKTQTFSRFRGEALDFAAAHDKLDES